MQKVVFGLALFVAACSDPTISSGPSEAEIREAYLNTGDVLLGNDLLNGELQLSEFKKISCTSTGQNIFYCKFYAKFGVSNLNGDRDVIQHIIGSQSGYFREATFFQNSAGEWVCAEVTDATLRDNSLSPGSAGN